MAKDAEDDEEEDQGEEVIFFFFNFLKYARSPH